MTVDPRVLSHFPRRDFLKAGLSLAVLGSAGALAGCSGGGDGSVAVQPPAPVQTPTAVWGQPTALNSTNGLLSTTLTCTLAQNTFNGQAITTQTYNGTIPGPTLRVKPGDTLRILVDNQFPQNPDPMPANLELPHHPNSTNLHTHGLHVSPLQDNVLEDIEPGASRQYEYTIPADHPSGTFWYHPHHHGSTAVQLFGGMAGALIVEGTDADTVPEVAAADDLVFLINELNIDPNTGSVPPYTSPNVFVQANSHFAVNGQYQPHLQILPGQVVRLRILNCTVRQTLSLTLVDGGNTQQDLHVIAYDGITLPTTSTRTTLTMAAANRADVMLKLSTPGTYEVRNGATVIAYVDVAGSTLDMALPTVLPAPAALPPVTAGEVTEMRTLEYQVNAAGLNPPYDQPPAPGWNNFTINGVRFDPTRVDQAINLGAVIEWTLNNNSGVAHPHHIHINPFYVVANSDATQPVNVWLDTVNVPPNGGSVTVRQRIEDFTGDFVLHCHILVHEDIGMMQLVRVS